MPDIENDRLITIAIHTYDRAVALRNLLQREGIEAVLHNVNLDNPVISSGIRVRIHENDLPMALRIIENYEIIVDNRPEGADRIAKTILVPVDFSDYSLRAAKMAFHIADKQKATIRLLNSFINPAVSKRVQQLTDKFSFDITDTREVVRALSEEARARMDQFETQLKLAIKSGEIPPVKFTTEIAEGVPEDTIVDIARHLQPKLIVMGTREANRKEEELIGSVTVEVLDLCRSTILTVPENINLKSLDQISNLVLFSNLEQEDFLALEELARLFADHPVNITIVHVPGKKDREDTNREAMANLLKYCTEHYPQYNFSTETIRLGNFVEDYRKIARNHNINLIAIPNKKRNVFSRFFNPSLAHKLLLHADIPMIAIPV